MPELSPIGDLTSGAIALDPNQQTIYAISASGLTVVTLPSVVDQIRPFPWPYVAKPPHSARLSAGVRSRITPSRTPMMYAKVQKALPPLRLLCGHIGSVEFIPRLLAIVIILVLIDFNDVLGTLRIHPFPIHSIVQAVFLGRKNADRDLLQPLSINRLVGP